MTAEMVSALITIAGGFLNFTAVKCAVRAQQSATKNRKGDPGWIAIVALLLWVVSISMLVLA